MSTPKTHKCSYCHKPAIDTFAYRGYVMRAGRAPFCPVIRKSACADHKDCPNFVSMRAIQTERRRVQE